MPPPQLSQTDIIGWLISWNAPNAANVEIHVGSPNDPLFASGGNHGSAQTGPWVTVGTTFYLQDVSGGKPLTANNTLATAGCSFAEVMKTITRTLPALVFASALGCFTFFQPVVTRAGNKCTRA